MAGIRPADKRLRRRLQSEQRTLFVLSSQYVLFAWKGAVRI